ncbi:MAG TPA: hypothetical protein VKZ81_22430 [Pseudonocardia sp.]|jgi:hypothetical protein|uniref:hypothetical protein n=1 Tax=Pseudonocardia sp. TaxID=60912 RepID=UPI002B4B1896|nr:hypothetical protein [Pseudonocardia sp.]HLU58225.1 hypothetical protein [Pseudonocardia sp.]
MAEACEFARAVAGAVLARMAADGGPRWTVLDASPSEGSSTPPTAPSGVVHVRITAGSAPSSPDVVAVYFTTGVPGADAVVATASQLQDHAIEATGGTPLPACPGHGHPLTARVLDGDAYWVCPHEPAHHRDRILPLAVDAPAAQRGRAH